MSVGAPLDKSARRRQRDRRRQQSGTARVADPRTRSRPFIASRIASPSSNPDPVALHAVVFADDVARVLLGPVLQPGRRSHPGCRRALSPPAPAILVLNFKALQQSSRSRHRACNDSPRRVMVTNRTPCQVLSCRQQLVLLEGRRSGAEGTRRSLMIVRFNGAAACFSRREGLLMRHRRRCCSRYRCTRASL